MPTTKKTSIRIKKKFLLMGGIMEILKLRIKIRQA
jgi:hypothetical protein